MALPIVSLAYLPAAIGLGALHALEPGHAKTMTAAYLIGIHGRWTDAVLLGLAAALTHSLVVIGIAVTALLVGRQAFAGEATWWLQIGSGAIVTLLGAWMLWRRLGAHHPPHPPAAPVLALGPRQRCEVVIAGDPSQERLHLRFAAPPSGPVMVVISRPEGAVERLECAVDPTDARHLISLGAPREPHAFTAVVELAEGERLAFAMSEPEGHDHHDDLAHAKAHAERMPAYVGSGRRPGWWQVVAFGAAGGLVPCPASISVMLLALSVGSSVNGLILVIGFSLGLAMALIAVGLVVVIGLGRLDARGRFSALTRQAPAISAGIVIASGLAALLMGLFAGHHADPIALAPG